jgi:hypothetical protein
MATSKEQPANAGKAIITSFRYYKGFCFVTLSNGVEGIIGQSSDMPLGVMLTLKGQEIAYTFLKQNGEYKQYKLGFAL